MVFEPGSWFLASATLCVVGLLLRAMFSRIVARLDADFARIEQRLESLSQAAAAHAEQIAYIRARLRISADDTFQ